MPEAIPFIHPPRVPRVDSGEAIVYGYPIFYLSSSPEMRVCHYKTLNGTQEYTPSGSVIAAIFKVDSVEMTDGDGLVTLGDNDDGFNDITLHQMPRHRSAEVEVTAGGVDVTLAYFVPNAVFEESTYPLSITVIHRKVESGLRVPEGGGAVALLHQPILAEYGDAVGNTIYSYMTTVMQGETELVEGVDYNTDLEAAQIDVINEAYGDMDIDVTYHWVPEEGVDYEYELLVFSYKIKLLGGTGMTYGAGETSFLHMPVVDSEHEWWIWVDHMFLLDATRMTDGKYMIRYYGDDGALNYVEDEYIYVKDGLFVDPTSPMAATESSEETIIDEIQQTEDDILAGMSDIFESEGLRLVTINISNDDDPPSNIVGAKVQLFDEANDVAVSRPLTTDSGGDVSLNLPDGTYSVRVFSPLFSFETSEQITVTSIAVDFEITGSGIIFEEPSNEDSITVYYYIKGQDSSTPPDADDVEATAYIVELPYDYNGKLHSKSKVDGVYDEETGLVYWNIVYGAKVRFEIPIVGMSDRRQIPTNTELEDVELTELEDI